MMFGNTVWHCRNGGRRTPRIVLLSAFIGCGLISHNHFFISLDLATAQLRALTCKPRLAAWLTYSS